MHWTDTVPSISNSVYLVPPADIFGAHFSPWHKADKAQRWDSMPRFLPQCGSGRYVSLLGEIHALDRHSAIDFELHAASTTC